MDQVFKTRAIRLHACSRCGGDLFLDTLEAGPNTPPEFVCLQCGRRLCSAPVERTEAKRMPVLAGQR